MDEYEKQALDEYLTTPIIKKPTPKEKQEGVDYFGETIYRNDFVFVYYFCDQRVETENTLLISYRKYAVKDENVGKLLEEKGISNLVDSLSESYSGKDWLKLYEH